MKKITKISKIFLVLTIIFSQLSQVVTVLADEIITKPLLVTLDAVINDDLGYVEKYEFSYISEKNDYEDSKEYTIELESSFTYLNGTIENGTTISEVKTGSEINNVRNKCDLNPISSMFNGTFNLKIAVKDSGVIIYEENIPYIVNSVKSGLVGTLNNGEIESTSNIIENASSGEFTVVDEKMYTSNLTIIPGNLSPDDNYRVVKGESVLVEGTGNDILVTLNGNSIDTTSLLGGTYTISDTITIEEIEDDVVVDSMEYTYDANINYDKDNDTMFSTLTSLNFEDGYLFENAVGYNGSTSVSTIYDIVNNLADTDIEIIIYDDENNILDLEDDNILNSEVKNNYKIVFKKGLEVSYIVVVSGDNTYDNKFDVQDMKPTMEDYLEDNKVLSMDDVKKENEEFGTLTFDDIMSLNMKLNNIIEYEENNNLGLVFGDTISEIFVGDTFELKVLVKSDNLTDYINGIDAIVTNSDNLKLTNIEFNNKLIGATEGNKFVAAGGELANEDVVLTLEFTAIACGNASISLSGSVAKNDIINEIATLTKEINIVRNISTNNNLSSLNANIGTFDIAFDKDATVYTLTVPFDTEKVILSGSLEDVNSTVSGLIEYTLTEDKTVANIIVTAEDGNEKVYTVYIIKEAKPVDTNVATPVMYTYSSNNFLKVLEIDGYEILFDRETTEYIIGVNSDVTSLDIKAIPESNKASVQITGNEKFKKGSNTVLITVTAEDGSAREYKITVNKEAEKKDALTEVDDSSNTTEKVVIIILIILVVLGLLYLIFKKDDEEVVSVEPKKDITPRKENTSSKNNNSNNQKKKNKK